MQEKLIKNDNLQFSSQGAIYYSNLLKLAVGNAESVRLLSKSSHRIGCMIQPVSITESSN